MKRSLNVTLEKDNLEVLKFSSMAIEKSNKIIFEEENIKYKLIILENKIIFERETEEFINSFEFIENKKTNSSYKIKENDYYLDIEIFTKKILKTNEKLMIIYEVLDSKEEFSLIVERN